MEYDSSLIEQFLKTYGFNTNKIEIEKIKHVPMHQYKISTEDKTLLYIDNLQCCIGLYAYGNGFAFAAHINTVVFEQNEYLLDENKSPIYCNRCNDLYKEIIHYRGIITETFKIGIAIGCSPLASNEKSITLIYQELKYIIKKLNFLGIKTIQLEDIYAPELIIDSESGEIILPNNKHIKIKHI